MMRRALWAFIPRTAITPSPHLACLRPSASAARAAAAYSTSMSYEPSGPDSKVFNARVESNVTPSLTYWLGNTLYLSVTDRCNATPLHNTRGPGFRMPASSNFRALTDSQDPSLQMMLSAAQGELAQSHTKGLLHQEVVFAGWGEPTLRWGVVCELAEHLRRTHRHIHLRLNTNGLGGVATQRCIVPDIKSLFHSVTVALNTAYPGQYDEIMRPDLSMRSESLAIRPMSTMPCHDMAGSTSAHAHVVSFIRTCVDHGVPTEVTAVTRPDVDMKAVKSLVQSLGADFRSRAYFE